MSGSIYYKMQGSLHRVQEQDVHSGSHGTDWKQKIIRNQLLCLSCATQPLALLCLARCIYLSPSLQTHSLHNNRVQDGWPTGVALEPCSQDIYLHMTLSQVSKPQFPRKKWQSLDCIPVLGQSPMTGSSGYHTVQIYCTESALLMGERSSWRHEE